MSQFLRHTFTVSGFILDIDCLPKAVRCYKCIQFGTDEVFSVYNDAMYGRHRSVCNDSMYGRHRSVYNDSMYGRHRSVYNGSMYDQHRHVIANWAGDGGDINTSYGPRPGRIQQLFV